MTARELYSKILAIPGQSMADALDILQGCFGLDRVRFACEPGRVVDEAAAQKVLSELRQGMPSAYVVGRVEFDGVTILVSPDVLIPRPETEELVARISGLKLASGARILDLCTGSGCIAIAIKKAFPQAEVYASDISLAALQMARRSAALNDVHIEFLESDLFANIPGRFDLIISNPPYIPSSARVEADFEPALALFSGTDGMDAMRGIAADLFAWLNPEGRAFFEIEPENSKSLIFLLENQASVADVRARVYGLTDMEGKDRFIAVERY